MKLKTFLVTLILLIFALQQGTGQGTSTLQFSTLPGGNAGSEYNMDVAVDNNGNILICGQTNSSDFPTTDGSSFEGGYDAFLVKYDANGTLIYSKLFGAYNVGATAVTVDDQGNTYVTGRTYHGAYFELLTADAYQSTPGGLYDVFIVKFDPSGNLLYGTLFGGNASDVPNDIVLDANGNMLLCGYTHSQTTNNFPLENPWDDSFGADIDAFAFKLSADGQTLMYSTYLGGADNGDPSIYNRDEANGIAVDINGNAYITGLTVCLDFPVTSGVFQPVHTTKSNWYEGEAFVTKLDPNGQAVYSSFLGGTGAYGEAGNAITADDNGVAYVAGRAWNGAFPVTAGAYDTDPTGDGFVVKISADGSQLLFSTAIGGTPSSDAKGIAVDASGNVTVTVNGTPYGFPELDPFDPPLPGGYNGISVAKLSPDGTTLLNSANIGGDWGEDVFDLELDDMGSIYITGWTMRSWPVTSGNGYPGGANQRVFISKIMLGPAPPPPPPPITLNPVSEGGHLGFDVLDIADANNDGIKEFLLDVQGRIESRYFNCTGVIGYGQQWNGSNAAEYLHIDNDGYIDLAITSTWSNKITFYKNNQNGGFSQVLQVYNSTNPFKLAGGDYDNDGDDDLLVGGWHQDCYILRNDNGTFVHAATLPGTNHRAFALEWADLDGDLDLDIILGGQNTNPSNDIPVVWKNNGIVNGNLEFIPKWYGSYADYQYMQYVRVGDVDADGDIDFMLCVYDGNWGKFAKIIRNDGDFNFAHAANVPGIFRHLADWGDYDEDGDLEILYLEPFNDPNGQQNPYKGYPAIYDYDMSNGTFNQVWIDQTHVFQNITASDFDGDAVVDFLGHYGLGKIYLNGKDLVDCGPGTSNQDPDCSLAEIDDQFVDENCEATISGDDVSGVTDPDGDPLTITVSPEVLALGVNTVTIQADDGNGGICTIDISVNVLDNSNPVITCPEDITVPNDPDLCGAVVTFEVEVTDNCDENVNVVSVPASGSFFPLGTTLVESTATDASGNETTCTMSISVFDTQSPVITCPDDITVPNDPEICGAVVFFEATATDNCDESVTVVSVPESGSLFPVGTTAVIYTATDGSGNESTCTINVDVFDNESPVITLLGDNPMEVVRFSGAFSDPGANVADNCDPNPALTISGTVNTNLPGEYTLTYVALDVAGNQSQVTRTVSVVDDPNILGHTFLYLADKKIMLDKMGQSEGDMHSNDEIDIKKGPVTYFADITAVGKIDIDKNITIDGDVTAGGELQLANNVVITGTATSYGNVSSEPLPQLSYSAGGQNVKVKKNKTKVLAPGSYGKVEVEDKATLKLSTGDYFFEELKMKKKANLEITLTTGPVTVNVVKKAEFKKRVLMSVLPFGESDSRYVSVNSMEDVQVDQNSTMIGSFTAPEGKIQLKKDVYLRGSLCAEEIDIDKNADAFHHYIAPVTQGSSAPLIIGEELSQADDMLQNYPNPFRTSTMIEFEIAVAGEYMINVFDMHGRKVTQLGKRNYQAGTYEQLFKATGLQPGIYFYQLKGENINITKKMILMN